MGYFGGFLDSNFFRTNPISLIGWKGTTLGDDTSNGKIWQTNEKYSEFYGKNKNNF